MAWRIVAIIGSAVGCSLIVLVLFAIPALALIAGLVGAWFPVAARARQRRLGKQQMRQELPVLLDRLASGIQAGQSLTAAFVDAAFTADGRLAQVLRNAAADVRATADLTQAVRAAAQTLQDPMADRAFLAVRAVAAIAGSSAPALLHAAAAQIRSDIAAQAEVDAKQSWVTASAGVAVSAPWVTVAVMTLHASAADAYRSRTGGYVLLVAGALCALGYAGMCAIGRPAASPRVVRP